MCSYYYYAVEKSRRAYEEYLKTGDYESYITFVRNYDYDDLDSIPRLAEEDDVNSRTSPYRVNYVSEMYVVACDKMKFYPFA